MQPTAASGSVVNQAAPSLQSASTGNQNSGGSTPDGTVVQQPYELQRQPQFYEGVTLSEYNDLRARHIITPYGFSAEPLAPAAAPDGSPQSNAAAPGTADPPAVLSSGAVVNAPFTRVDPCRAG
jgi:hypothetical protein